jgi:hypothetical protein
MLLILYLDSEIILKFGSSPWPDQLVCRHDVVVGGPVVREDGVGVARAAQEGGDGLVQLKS